MLLVIIGFCPVHCPHCGMRLRLVENQQRRDDFFNGAAEGCSCGVVFTFMHSSIPAAALSMRDPDPQGGKRD